MNVTIAGKAVVLRDRFPLGEYHQLVAASTKMWPIERQDLTVQQQIEPIMPVVVSWEFPGSPQDLVAWGELDVFGEFLPLWQAISDHLVGLYEAGRAAEKK